MGETSKQALAFSNQTDSDGNPAGGCVSGLGIKINWQDGPLGRGAERKEPNGAFVEEVILAAKQRIEHYQEATEGRFRCRENACAITKLDEALHWLHARTQTRESRGVEGMHEA